MKKLNSYNEEELAVAFSRGQEWAFSIIYDIVFTDLDLSRGSRLVLANRESSFRAKEFNVIK